MTSLQPVMYCLFQPKLVTLLSIVYYDVYRFKFIKSNFNAVFFYPYHQILKFNLKVFFPPIVRSIKP